ncbi:exonuclease RecJ [Mesocricetibacter intestinalis]|uniref:Single-stranded-DNA-specific exonuclease RecJ n=1 Tax=Mesocricetibacter intestinalis TaxID=1521930 RepID=A0A4R6VGN2_9PAST|nr:single-stranded-DNA-specific exonuclease RecJ [Mesocricetibacter intestinalis]TDQ57025.1 exonuclease RecJ [Mesocricetibacter intestinalis]
MNKLIQRRIVPEGVPVCDDPLLDRLYRARRIQTARQLDRSLPAMLSPYLLQGIEAAVDLLLEARHQNRKIVIVGDFDADGATSTALCVKALRLLGFTRVDYLLPNRFEQGYGLSVEVAKLALEKDVELLMTVDNGISSVQGVAFLKAQGVRVLLTDHHLAPEVLPAADAIVNPNLADCAFPSKALAGVGVAFYVMLALRAKLRELNEFDQKTQPNFTDLLDFVALGTVADVVPLDQNNRILVHQGLSRIRAGHCSCGIRALIEIANKDIAELSAGDLGFSVAPRLNAAGRLDNMSVGVELLLSEDMSAARALALELDGLNQTRKEIEQGMKLEALEICRNLTALQQSLPLGIALYQADWHQGVLGILAARIKEQFHRPVVAFARDQNGILKGSARSVEGLHIRDILEFLHNRYPQMILKFGGHAMAAGLSIPENLFEQFQSAFNQAVSQWFDEELQQDKIWTDGELSPALLTLDTAERLRQAGPWGQAFPPPLFDGEFNILQQRLVGEKHLKMLVETRRGGTLMDAIAFNVDTRYYPDLSIKRAKFVYKLDINQYRGNRNLQLIVDYIQPCG